MMEHPCEIAFDPEGIKNLASYIKKPYSSFVLITDETVFKFHGERVSKSLKGPLHTLTIGIGEKVKSLATAERCWQQMQAVGVDRNALVITLGGGVVSDLGGFVASCYMRGVDVIHIPTTLMGMVDAAIGGKTAVNLGEGKNMVGSFHHPKVVLLDPKFLETLPDRHFRSGLAEVIKYGVVWDPALFHYMEENMLAILARQPEKVATIISRSCQIKAEIVKQDEEDHTVRQLLNYGHTFGHALEAMTGYNQFLHGEAVAIGMHMAARLSLSLGLTDEAFVRRQEALLHLAGLALEMPTISYEKLISLMAQDKKGANTYILPKAVGKASIVSSVIFQPGSLGR